ncbi:hypothetical protein TNCV_4400541 [Trichonephila clavipes]|nr:hypothetical protein TNCV_4400541 [Trichonephila clavipes]
MKVSDSWPSYHEFETSTNEDPSYSDESIRLNESACAESEEGADVIDNIPVSHHICVARDGTEWIPNNSNVPGRFAI